MTAKSSRSSIVATKYGSRPLIDVPPISFGDIRHSSAPAQLPNQYPHGNLAHNLGTYNPPATNPQASFLPPAVPQNTQKPFWSNVLQNSNIVPFNYVHPPYQNGIPNYQGQVQPPSNGHPFQQPVPDPRGDIHHFYGPNGEVLPGPPPKFGTHGQNYFNRTMPMDFKLEGKLEYGRLVSIQVKESNISYRDLPSFLIKDLKRMYGRVHKTYVTIIAEDGEYNIYATPNVKSTDKRSQGYIYEEMADNHLYDRKGNVYSVDFNRRQPRDQYVVANEPRLPVQKPDRR